MRFKRNRTKYGSHKTIVDGITFHSKREADYYCELKLRKRIGEIKDFTLQPKYTIIDSYRCPLTGRKIPETTYSADFLVIELDGTKKVVDVKSEVTRKKESYRIKKKAFEQRYGIPIHEVC